MTCRRLASQLQGSNHHNLLTDLSLSDIRQRVADGVPVVKWDSDDYALDDDRETCHARILADIKRLRASGCELWFRYRPAPNNYLPYLDR